MQCWDECAKPSTLKDRNEDGNDDVAAAASAADNNEETPTIVNKPIRETWSLHTVSMLQQDSLVLVDVAWQPTYNTPNQCLVTWEVSGGGLMGNLLTESFNVQLSLWPETKYRVQVTCKNKVSIVLLTMDFGLACIPSLIHLFVSIAASFSSVEEQHKKVGMKISKSNLGG